MSGWTPSEGLARLAAILKGWRLSPAMFGGLALLGTFAAASTLFAAAVFFASNEIKARSAAWRPAASMFAPLPSSAAAKDVQTLTRPPFAKSRRPGSPSANAGRGPADSGGPPPPLQVEAIVRADETPRAYLVRSGEHGDWYSVGQSIKGRTITEIHASAVRLTSGTRSAKVSLYPHSAGWRRSFDGPQPAALAGRGLLGRDGVFILSIQGASLTPMAVRPFSFAVFACGSAISA